MVHKTRVNKTILAAAISSLVIIYHSIVRDIRTKSGNATLGILLVMAQSLIMMIVFALLYKIIGARSLAIRGDFVLFLLSGIFLFLVHNRAIASVKSAASPTDSMLLHTPLNTLISIAATALAGLYMQIMTIFIILFVVALLRGSLDVYNPAGLLLPFFMAWASGVAIGMLFLVATPFAPKLVPILSQLYRRANMITSGKMLPANYMTAGMVKWFAWNPLFHTIDQARGEAFINYYPHRTNMEYPVIFTVAAITFALMAEAWLRKNMSQSWGKRSRI